MKKRRHAHRSKGTSCKRCQVPNLQQSTENYQEVCIHLLSCKCSSALCLRFFVVCMICVMFDLCLCFPSVLSFTVFELCCRGYISLSCLHSVLTMCIEYVGFFVSLILHCKFVAGFSFPPVYFGTFHYRAFCSTEWRWVKLHQDCKAAVETWWPWDRTATAVRRHRRRPTQARRSRRRCIPSLCSKEPSVMPASESPWLSMSTSYPVVSSWPT